MRPGEGRLTLRMAGRSIAPDDNEGAIKGDEGVYGGEPANGCGLLGQG